MQSDVFTMNMAGVGRDGDFLGVVPIALKRQYFGEFYAELTNSKPAFLVGLYRQDGTIQVRLPDKDIITNPAADTPFATALGQAVPVGRVDMVSTVDGIERILSFRLVGRYPPYVAGGYATAAIHDQWRRHVIVVAMLTLVPCIGLWAMRCCSGPAEQFIADLPGKTPLCLFSLMGPEFRLSRCYDVQLPQLGCVNTHNTAGLLGNCRDVIPAAEHNAPHPAEARRGRPKEQQLRNVHFATARQTFPDGAHEL
ncbi:hypothetical protein PQR29_06165 [Paraburkholderia strydomiana]|uniref:hypothetical protein n=1 Tax=Paraburkholderia strydomiana TaxID=1245417 RepID=UPI0038BE17E7